MITFNMGKSCCTELLKANDGSCPTSNGLFLQWDDPATCCDALNTIDCPGTNGVICTDADSGKLIHNTHSNKLHDESPEQKNARV
jgi:hypothetical protein